MTMTLISPADRLAQMIERSFGRDVFQPNRSDDVSTRTWAPPVDIRETPDALVVTAEVPGLPKEDINITVENNTLSFYGERKFEKDIKKEDWHRVERSYGGFSRTFSLPTNVQADQAKAEFKDGVLTITLPKREESRPRRLEIK